MPDLISIDASTLVRWAVIAGAILLALAAFVVLRRLLSRPKQAQPPVDLVIDVASLPAQGPDLRAARLELRGIPVRLAVLVLAPLGRNEPLPLNLDVADFAEHVAPGLGPVAESHGPIVYRWPPQLSWQGFANTFFTNLRLPGDRGKGSPWAAVCGRFDRQGKKYLVGMALCAAAPNGLGCLRIENEGQWGETLRALPPGDTRR